MSKPEIFTDDEVLFDELAKFLPSQTLTRGRDLSEELLGDWSSEIPGQPLARVKPRSTKEVSKLLSFCHVNDIPVVPQGGLTGLAGGAVASNRSILISLESMSGIEDFDQAAGTIDVMAGTVLQVLQEKVEAEGFMFALDFGARGSAQIGGAIATNAGGNRVIRYGMMRDLVLGLEVVLPDGTIMNMMNRMRKNNAGPDLKHLYIGSEGIFGIITRAVLRINQGISGANTAFIGFDSFENALATLNYCQRNLSGRVSAFELMWPDYYETVLEHPDNRRPLTEQHALYGLIDLQSSNPDADTDIFIETLSTCLENGIIEDVVIAQSKADTADFWAIRDSVGELLQAGSSAIAFDISLPTPLLGKFVVEANKMLAEKFPELKTIWFGHAGDGNLHLIADPTGENQSGREVEDSVYKLLATYGGSISAEHGIGLHKKPWLALSRTKQEIATLHTLKLALDPKNIMNPGKII